MDLMFTTFFIFILFIFLICSVFIIRKRLIKKAMLLEIDEDLKNLAPKEFFLKEALLFFHKFLFWQKFYL